MLGVRVPPGLPLYFAQVLQQGDKVTKKKVRKIKATAPGASKKPAEAAGSEKAASPAGATAAVQSGAPESVGRIAAVKQFVSDVRAELDRITWASKKETISLTVAVLAITVFFSSYLGLVDIALSKLVGTLIK